MFKYAILGPVELSDGERRLPVGGPRQLALLALLLVNANRPLSRDWIIAALWGDLGSGPAGKRLQVAIGRLRRTLDPEGVQVLRTVPGGYVLEVRDGDLDAEVFRTRVEDGRRALEDGDPERARDVLRAALAMWRGPALAEVAYHEFAQTEIRRLEELRLAAVEARVDCELQLGAHSGAIGELEALVAAHPGRERLAAQLMLALDRSGRQRDALDVYARTRVYLAGELGLEPGPALQALQAEILAQSPMLQPRGAGRLPTGVVTFLLTDIEGSTGLWEADSDAMAAALAVHDALVARLVERHGGRQLKDKSEGDSTCSVFQRASDAVACAAEVHGALATALDDGGLQLRLRIALHSGEAQERAGDYLGPTLNRASRLRSLAAGGVTVLSRTTAELVRDRLPRELSLVDVGRHELRGLSRPEHVFELRASAGAAAGGPDAAAAPVALPLPRSLHTAPGSRFVGRIAELERLRECWTGLPGGAGSAVVVGGEAGIGKTRLASELARAVHEQGALVLYGRCDEGLAVPYQPFVQALRPYAAAVGLDRLRTELGHLAPELGRLLPELATLGLPMRADPESERFALFEAVAALVEAATRRQPMLLILDDLHWATSPTLLLLRHLIRSERRLRVLLLCTHRAAELHLGEPLAQLLADLHGDDNVQRLSLAGLDEPAIAALLEAAVGQALDERAAALVRVLEAQTAGNPFFIRELLANVVESGSIPAARERLDARVTAAQLEVPAGLRHVIGQRVARLSAPTGRALNVAAVAGPRFSFAVLERVLGEDAGVLDALDEATAAGLLTEAGHGGYAFAHTLVRQTLYERLGSLRRARLHGQVGEALEALPGADAYVETLAHHFSQAAADGQGVKAADYALAAGHRATGRLGYEEAAAHYEQGLEALALTGQPEEQRRCELLIALGDARWDTGDLGGARQASGQAAELAQRLHDRTALARAALSYCGPNRFELAAAVTQPVVDLLQRALAALGDEPSPLRAQLLGRLATFTDVKRKPVLARQALDMARQVAEPATLAGVLASTIWATHGPDTLHDSVAMTQELGRLADDVGDSRLRALAHEWLLDHLLELGDIEAAEREFQALQRLAEARRERYFKWHVTAIRANHAHLRGGLERCEALAHEALAHRFEGHDEPATNTFWAQMFFVRREQGRLDELVEAVESFAAQSPQLPVWRCGLASIYAQLGRRADAHRELEALAGADFADLPRDTLWLVSLSWLTEVAVFLGDAQRARPLYELLSPYADRCVVVANLLGEGSVSRPLGLLATTLSRDQDAARHFEHALEINAHIRSPLWVAHTQHDYARMLLLRDGPGDRDTALELLAEALATAEQLGLKALADKAQLLKPAAGDTSGIVFRTCGH
jgi:DNA-binding SARP family transcriptional activator/tetratricopeptide (TPR) repeat protein